MQFSAWELDLRPWRAYNGGMLDLKLKLIPRPAPSAPGGDEEDEPCWKYIGSDMAHSHLPAKLQYAGRLMVRAHNRGVRLESLYVTETEKRISSLRKRVTLAHGLLCAMARHEADFSYGAFSSFYERSRYALGSFFVLRFRKKFKDLFCRIISGEMKEYHVWMECCGETPYMIFDAREDGVCRFFDELASMQPLPQSRSLFLLDYFTNSPWCWVDLDPYAIAALAKTNSSIRIEIRQKMRRPQSGKEAPFWKHVFRAAKQHLGKQKEEAAPAS